MGESSKPTGTSEGVGAEQGKRPGMHWAVLYINHEGCPNTDVTRRFTDVRTHSVSRAYTDRSRKKQLLEIETRNTAVSEFVDAYRSHDRVEEVALYPNAESDDVAHISTVIDYDGLTSISDILASHGVYRGATATAMAGSERWRAYFESHADIATVIDAIEARGNRVTIDEKLAIELEAGQTPRSSMADLTPRQREVFLTAMEYDYFAMHSDADLETLADELDLSTSVVWEHLSRAKHKILSAVASDVVE